MTVKARHSIAKSTSSRHCGQLVIQLALPLALAAACVCGGQNQRDGGSNSLFFLEPYIEAMVKQTFVFMPFSNSCPKVFSQFVLVAVDPVPASG